MEVHFTPEQQAQLALMASKAGTDPERLVTTVVARYLDAEARFLAAVEKGLAAAERGEFIEDEEMAGEERDFDALMRRLWHIRSGGPYTRDEFNRH